MQSSPLAKIKPTVYIGSMPKRSRTRLDVNQLARAIVDQATGETPPDTPAEEKPGDSGKDPAAVALGRRGGLKGGPARAAKLTSEQRSESAKRAAAARWGKPDLPAV
jgi:hypothetical protein